MTEIQNIAILRKNMALHHLKKTLPRPYRYAFSKLANELTLIITKRCNLRCVYCYDKSNIPKGVSLNKPPSELTKQEIITLIKQVKDLGCYKIRITGGEPFLKEGIWEILKECKDMDVNICTNGTLLDKVLSKLKEIKFSHLHIHTSIDGISTHRKYRLGSDPIDILNKIRLAKKEIPNISISVNTVLNQENIGELIEIYNNIKSIGINRWTVSFPRFVEKAQLSYFKVPPIKTMIREFKKLLKLYFKDNKPFIFTFSYFYKHELLDEKFHKLSIPKKEDHPCLPDSSGCKGLIVDSFGNLLDCLVMPPLLSSPTNIRDCLKNNDVSCLMKKIYDSLKSPYYELSLGQFETCWHCRYRNLCRGGCPANMWWLTDKLNTPDVISCALFYIFEKEILKLLPMNEKKKFTNAIDLTKPIKNIKEIIKSNKKTLIQIGLFH